MGLLDAFEGVSVHSGGLSRPAHRSSHSHSHKKHRSRSRSRSGSRHRSRSFAGSFFGVGGDSHYHKHNSSRGSFFGLGGNSSRSSFFGLNRSSYYKRSPRQGFMHRAVKQVKRIFRDLTHYARRHPWKVFFLVVMPLVTTGALTALLARFGLRMPPALERMLGMASRAASGDSIGLVGDAMRMAGGLGGAGASSVRLERGRDGGMEWERRSGHSTGGGGFMGDGIMGVAKMFI